MTEIPELLEQISQKIELAKTDRSAIVPSFCEAMRRQVTLLEYLCAANRDGVKVSTLPEILKPVCSEEGCNHDWRSPDACLLRIGQKWFCRDHHPRLKAGGVRPVGYSDPDPAAVRSGPLQSDPAQSDLGYE